MICNLDHAAPDIMAIQDDNGNMRQRTNIPHYKSPNGKAGDMEWMNGNNYQHLIEIYQDNTEWISI